MKIVMVNKYYFLRGGTERYMFDVSDLLTSHGHTVIPFAMEYESNLPSNYSSFFVSDIATSGHISLKTKVRLFFRFFYSLHAKRKFKALIEQEKPDLVHLHNIYHQISPSILDVCKTYGIPVVQTVHDYHLICPNYKLFCGGKIDESCKGGTYYRELWGRCVSNSYPATLAAILELYFIRITGIYTNNVAAWIVPSSFVAKKLAEFGMPASRMVTLPHFTDVEGITPQYAMGRYLLCYGRLSEEKGFEVMIRAMQDLSLPLKIVGEGPMRASLAALVVSLGLGKKVEFLGFKLGDELDQLISHAALVVVPSIWHEVFGYTLIESFSRGKVVVGSKAGAITEILSGIDKKLLFAMGDPKDLARKVTWVLGHRREAQKAAKKGRKWVETALDPERHYTDLMKVYMRVIRGNKGRVKR